MKPTPRFILALFGLVSIFILGAGAYGVWFAINASAWFRIGFEAILVMAGVFGVLTAMGRFQAGPVWAMTCVGGATVVSALLANSAGGAGQVAGFSPGAIVRSAMSYPFAAARLGAGFGALALGALTLMLRHPSKSFRHAVIGLVCLAPVAAAGALWMFGPLGRLISSLHPVLQTVLAVFAFFAIVALVSAGGHNLIRSLEVGVEGQDEPRANAA